MSHLNLPSPYAETEVSLIVAEEEEEEEVMAIPTAQTPPVLSDGHGLETCQAIRTTFDPVHTILYICTP
jgi:hypothetical protein